MNTLADAVGPLFLFGLLMIPIIGIILVGIIEGIILYRFNFTSSFKSGIYQGIFINTLSLAIGLVLIPLLSEELPMWIKAVFLIVISIVSEGTWIYFRLPRKPWPVFISVVVGMNLFTALVIFIISKLT